MYSNITIPGLQGVTVLHADEREGVVHLQVVVPRKQSRCPACGTWTRRVHDYRWQRVQHTAWFERPTVLHYRKRRYVCPCGKRFAEANPLVDRYQRHSREWNQALGLRLVTGKNFTDTARQFSTSVTTALRRFDQLAARTLPHVEQLPRVIAVDEYKGDTNAGKYQLLVADGATGRPVDILPDRKKETLKQYLQQKGGQVEVVVMDMSAPFHQAARRALNRPIIVADRFHVHRHVYWALERVRRRVQHTLSSYHRKRCKRLKHVFTKKAEDLTARQVKIRDHYLAESEELRTAYELKEAFRAWFERSKRRITTGEAGAIRDDLYAFYRQVEASGCPDMAQAAATVRRWQTEILNSFTFDYHNGTVEGLNNQTKVIKRNAFGFQRYDRLRAKVLLHHQYKWSLAG